MQIDTKTIKILLVEDDVQLSNLIADYLRNYNLNVDIVHTGRAAIDFIGQHTPDLVVLDVMLPDYDGFDVCKAVKPSYEGPILFLTARNEEFDQMLGLELGADDYVVKPVSPRLLLARIKVLLRRIQDKTDGYLKKKVISTSDLVIDGRKRSVSAAGGREIAMSSYEFDLLWLLASRAGDVISREEIFSTLQGINYDGENRSVDIYICHLRSKIEADPAKPQSIKTVRGKGYIFVAN